MAKKFEGIEKQKEAVSKVYFCQPELVPGSNFISKSRY
jgi:hypothetical protein